MEQVYAFFFDPSILSIIISMIATTIAKIAAVQKPSTSNLFPITESLSIIMSTVMMNDIKPNVNQLIGKVNSLKMPPTTAFTNPITKPVTIAQPKPATVAPGTIYAAKAMTIPVINKLIINLIVFII